MQMLTNPEKCLRIPNSHSQAQYSVAFTCTIPATLVIGLWKLPSSHLSA